MTSTTLVESSRRGGFLRGMAKQIRVVRALMIRHMMVHYGRNNIGFLWLILHPMILCAGVIALRWFLQAHQEHGLSLVPFLISGYMPLTLWRHLSSSSSFLVRRSTGLLFHNDVTVLDLFLTTMILEFIGCTLAFVVNYTALLFMGLVDPIADVGLVAGGWCLMAAIGIGAGAAISVLTEQHEWFEHFLAPVQYLMLPICGFFFMVDWLPDDTQKLAWWMPTVHCYEMVRAGIFGETVQTHYSIAYPLTFALILLFIYVPRFEKVRDHVHFG